jgi:hypothetical protein
MKIFLWIVLALFLAGAVSAQTTSQQLTAAEYMKKTPAVPGVICHCDPSVKDAFLTSVSTLRQTIMEDADQRERQMADFMQSKEGDIKANMVKNSGISDEDMKKLQSGKKMTQEEKMEMANKMMQQQTNISMDEAKNLQKMSKAGKEAWAQGYATEQQAAAQAGVKPKNPMGDMVMAMNSNVAEQTALATKLQTLQSDLQQKLDALKVEGQAEKAQMNNELQPYYKIINSNNGEGATQKMVDEDKKARAQVKLRQDKYCEKLTPKMLSFLAESRSVVENALPDYDRMDELKYQAVENPAGKKLERKVTGIESIKAVAFYLGFVEETFIFRLN